MIHRLPWLRESERPAAVAVPAGFMVCPLALQANWAGGVCPWQAIYAAALEKAREVVRPSRLERFNRDLVN